MNWSRVYEIEKEFGNWYVVVTFFPYQFAVGVSFRWLKCTPGIRVYLGFVKIAVTSLRGG